MDLKEIAEKRQEQRTKNQIYKVVDYSPDRGDPKKPKFYILDMFPYPSGAGLHVGHPKGYIATDVIARKKTLQGFNVLHPMGFDTFGLGTEQYAIEKKMKPQIIAQQNIDNFKRQLKMFGLTYDRDRSFSTADPDYYKWTQRIFLQLYNHYYDEKLKKAMPISELEKKLKSGEIPLSAGEGLEVREKFLDSQRLAYVDFKPINRCPKCMTGLANEDLADGKCERCGTPVEQRPMKQRVLRITKYAERLLEGLDKLQRDEAMKDLERNRIGKSEGTQFAMQIAGTSKAESRSRTSTPDPEALSFEVYTTRVDTVYGMSFVAMAPEHPLVDQITTPEQKKAVEKYKEEAKHKSQLERTELQKDKTGVFCGAYAINPFNNTKVPIFIADYVLAGYGTGVVMAVPAHDKRDFEFAKKYKLPITQSIAPYHIDDTEVSTPRPDKETIIRKNIVAIVKHRKEDKYYVLNREEFGWKSFIIGGVEKDEKLEDAVAREVKEESGYQNFTVKKQVGFSCFENFYAAHKRVNRMAHAHFFLVELKNDTFIQPKEEHVKNHKGLWLEKEKINDRLTFPSHKYAREIYNNGEAAYHDKGILVNSADFSGLESDKAITEMQKRLEQKGIGGKQINYKMQDRVFSRQRYRGEPFPIVRVNKSVSLDKGRGSEAGEEFAVALDEKDLPLLLPDVENYEPTGTTQGPLANIDERVNITLPDGTKAKRETNTMPGRAGSSRYRLRYMDPKNTKELVSPEREKYRGEVDVYVGGAEHVTRHMIYARFWQKFLYDLGIVTHDEPFKEYHYVGLIMAEDGRKMSKRRGNTIDPDKVIGEFGHDTFRVYEMFMGPFDQAIARSTNGVKGAKKFLDKIIALQSKIESPSLKERDLGGGETKTLLNQTIKKITDDIDGFKFNTCISQLMILVNHLTELPSIDKKTFETLTILISPFAPHLAEELRSLLGNEFSIFTKAKWPSYDEKCLTSATIKIGVQFNGKVRGDICISKEATQDEVMAIVKADAKLNARLTSEPKKIIYVPGKILNIVI